MQLGGMKVKRAKIYETPEGNVLVFKKRKPKKAIVRKRRKEKKDDTSACEC